MGKVSTHSLAATFPFIFDIATPFPFPSSVACRSFEKIEIIYLHKGEKLSLKPLLDFSPVRCTEIDGKRNVLSVLSEGKFSNKKLLFHLLRWKFEMLPCEKRLESSTFRNLFFLFRCPVALPGLMFLIVFYFHHLTSRVWFAYNFIIFSCNGWTVCTDFYCQRCSQMNCCTAFCSASSVTPSSPHNDQHHKPYQPYSDTLRLIV